MELILAIALVLVAGYFLYTKVIRPKTTANPPVINPGGGGVRGGGDYPGSNTHQH